ncbi:BZ3500_MvSof-1268-A1-R1_Chr7-1g09108 [Microbotryum saponariae]|uniref:BZ3500_MvSof-1268-A1-R1_Chr7-1g09108 protein n=1 Tax=Microbotryum saponariae TaxID=289078 RepID=A0A2X0L0N3_9BASI|nr:BZ3501_MvSof-1269-A2-R1_Chr7-1g08813 [Microbotryum saponariae]SDA02816.1 BZ3500_MvSof-1268-A1-R1_Chr7-1g09108 [Microbotryum saponariae]
MSASSPYGTRSSTWSPDTTAKSESLSPKLCAVAEEDDQDLVYECVKSLFFSFGSGDARKLPATQLGLDTTRSFVEWSPTVTFTTDEAIGGVLIED